MPDSVFPDSIIEDSQSTVTRAYCETNLLIYAISDDPKRSIARRVLATADVTSVQSLNEFANILRKKFKKDWSFITTNVTHMTPAVDEILPLTIDTHRLGSEIASRYLISFYDSLHLAAACLANCTTFFGEDLQNGQKIGDLTVINPFLDDQLLTP